MKSIIFDHKTQIYVNDSEGLKIDHKYNNINITETGVDVNLKDNNASVNLGDSGATQQAETSGVKIIAATRKGSKVDVFELANNGDQVFKNINHYKQFIALCRNQIYKYKKNTFTYTLSLKSDFDKRLSEPKELPNKPANSPAIFNTSIINDSTSIEKPSDIEESIK